MYILGMQQSTRTVQEKRQPLQRLRYLYLIEKVGDFLYFSIQKEVWWELDFYELGKIHELAIFSGSNVKQYDRNLCHKSLWQNTRNLNFFLIR